MSDIITELSGYNQRHNYAEEIYLVLFDNGGGAAHCCAGNAIVFEFADIEDLSNKLTSY